MPYWWVHCDSHLKKTCWFWCSIISSHQTRILWIAASRALLTECVQTNEDSWRVSNIVIRKAIYTSRTLWSSHNTPFCRSLFSTKEENFLFSVLSRIQICIQCSSWVPTASLSNMSTGTDSWQGSGLHTRIPFSLRYPKSCFSLCFCNGFQRTKCLLRGLSR